MTQRVHVVALAARTALGFGAESSAAALRAGISRVREHPTLVDRAGENLACGYDFGIDPVLFGAPRLLALLEAALAELARKLPKLNEPPQLLLAVPEARPGFSAADLRALESRLASQLRVKFCGEGHAGALRALELALQHMQAGEPVCLVGGVDSYLAVETLTWLEADKRLARSNVRGGFLPGEAASVIALASDTARAQHRLPSLAQVRFASTLHESQRADAPEGANGRALSELFERASRALRSPERFDDVYCDINGERARSDDYAFALLRTGQWFRDGTCYVAGALQCGDLGAASGAFHCAAAARSWQRNYAAGPLALIWGASWSGLRGAAVLERSSR